MSLRPVSGSRVRVVIVGAGVYAPELCEVLAAFPGMPPLDLRLTARRPGRLAIIAHHAACRVALTRPEWRVGAYPSLGAALRGADAVILLVRVGGLAARHHDETFPERLGLRGDEGLGPGGFANIWRTIPVLSRIAATIRSVAPRARVLNLMAPLGLTTRFLLDRGLDVLGLCELPTTSERRLPEPSSVSRADEPEGLHALDASGEEPSPTRWRYAGLNHLGWFWPEEGWARLLEEAVRAGRVDPDVAAANGAVPLEYYYRVFDPAAADRLGMEHRTGRARHLATVSERLFRRYAEHPGEEVPASRLRPTPWFPHAVAPSLRAVLGGRPHRGFANVRNGGLVPELPPGIVVELRARISTTGAVPAAPGTLPPRVREFLVASARAEHLMYEAAVRRCSSLVARALRCLPLAIDDAAVRSLVSDICRACPPPRASARGVAPLDSDVGRESRWRGLTELRT